jgi:MFS family permease
MIWILFFGRLLGNTGYWMTRPLIPLYLALQLHADPWIVGLIAGLGSLFGFFGGLYGGLWVDQFGRRRAMLISVIGQVAIFVGYAFIENIILFSILAVLIGFFSFLQVQATDTVVADLSKPEDISRNYALLRIANNVGIALGPVIGVALYYINPSWAFLGTAILVIVFALFFFRFIQTDSSAVKRDQYSLKEYVPVIQKRRMTHFLIAGFFLSMAISQLNSTMPFVLEERLDDIGKLFGWMWSVNGLIVITCQYFLVRWTKGISLEKIMTISLLGYATAFGIFSLSTLPVWFIIGMVLFTLSELIWVPYAYTFVVEQAGERSKGLFLGTLSFQRLGFFAGPIIGSIIFSVWSGFVLYTMILVLLLFSAYLIWRIRTTDTHVESEHVIIK